MRSFYFALPFILVGCTSVKDISIPLDPTFKQEAQQLNLKRPQGWINADSFNQDLANYRIHDVQVITTLNQSHLKERSRAFFSSPNRVISNTILNTLFESALNNSVSMRYEIEKEREFAFNLSTSDRSNPSIQSSCLIQSLNDKIEQVSVGDATKSKSTSSKLERIFSGLQCEYTMGESTWNLSLSKNNQQEPIIELSRGFQNNLRGYQFSQVYGQLYLVNHEWRAFQDGANIPTGFTLQQGKQTAAALAFSEPKIWLHRNLTAEEQTLLFAASYSLILYDFFDPGWRRNFMNDQSLK